MRGHRHTADGGLVAARRFTSPEVANELARWCGGRVARGTTDPVIELPTRHGPRVVGVGDWVVRLSEHDFRPCTPQDFVAHYQPADRELASA